MMSHEQAQEFIGEMVNLLRRYGFEDTEVTDMMTGLRSGIDRMRQRILCESFPPDGGPS